MAHVKLSTKNVQIGGPKGQSSGATKTQAMTTDMTLTLL